MKITPFAVSAALAACALPASAASILISGVAGTNMVTMTLSGTAQVRSDDAIEPLTSAFFNNAIDMEFGDYMADASIQDVVATATGNMMISNGVTSTLIDGIFFDDDAFAPQTDDFGFRTSGSLSFVVGQDLAFSGSATLAYDITAFKPTSTRIASFDSTAIARDQLDLTVEVLPSPVPVSPALPMLGGGVALLAFLRRRKG